MQSEHSKAEPLDLNTREIKINGEPKPKTGKRLIKFFLPVCILALGFFISFWFMKTGPKAQPRPRAKNVTQVRVKTVSYSEQKTLISGMGSVVACRTVDLKPEVKGKVIEMNGDLAPGSYLHQGETILKIDPTDYLFDVKQLKNDVEKAQAEIQLEQGNQLVAQKEFRLLGEKVSPQEKALILRKPQLNKLKASLEAAKTKLEQAKVDLKNTSVMAPFNAVIKSRSVNIGAQASESSVLATLVGTDAYWVEVLVPVSKLRWIKVPNSKDEQGSLVKIYDSAFWGEGVYRTGRVIRLAVDLEEQGRMARILVQVDDPLNLKPENKVQPRMLIGSYVRVEITGKKIPAAVLLDREYLRNGKNVWVMDSKGRLSIKPVQIAFRGQDSLLITDGLEKGERLVISDLATPIQGMPLKTANSSSKASAKAEVKGQEDRS